MDDLINNHLNYVLVFQILIWSSCATDLSLLVKVGVWIGYRREHILGRYI